MPQSSFSGYDEEHKTSQITIENLFLNGELISSLDEANVQIGSFARGCFFEKIIYSKRPGTISLIAPGLLLLF